MTYQVDYSCDKEIGRPGGLWHVCGKLATYAEERHGPAGAMHTLYFCSKHAGTTKDENGYRVTRRYRVYSENIEIQEADDRGET